MKLIKETEKKKRNGFGWKRKLTSIIAGIVVFATTYALVLPAITLDDISAANEPGLSLSTTAENEEGLSADLETEAPSDPVTETGEETPADVDNAEITTPGPVESEEPTIETMQPDEPTPAPEESEEPVSPDEPTPAPEESEEPVSPDEPTPAPEESEEPVSPDEPTPTPEDQDAEPIEEIPVTVKAFEGLSDDAVLQFSWFDPEKDGASKINALQEILNGTKLYHAFDLELTKGEIADEELGATIVLAPYIPEKGAVLYHFTENSEYEELNYKVDEEAQTVTFVTMSFSPFAFGKAIVEAEPTETPDPNQEPEPVESSEPNNVFAVSCTGLSEDAELNLTKLQKEDAAYAAYAEMLQAVIGETAIYDILEIHLDAGEITSATGAKVRIDNFEIVDPEHTVLYHIKGDGAIEKLHFATGLRSVSFKTGSFSAFVFAMETEASSAIDYTEFEEEPTIEPKETFAPNAEPLNEDGTKGEEEAKGEEDPENRDDNTGSPNKIDNFEVTFSQGALPVPGDEPDEFDWVWTPEDSSEGHMFKFRITYTLWGELHYEPKGITIRVPESILVDRDGNPADKIWIPLPRVEVGPGGELIEPEGLTDENVFVYYYDEATHEYVIYNRLPFSTAEHAFIEVGYITTEETYEYADYDPTEKGNNPDDHNDNDKNGSKPFYASISLDPINGETISEPKKGNIPVYIDTNAEITSTDKNMPLYPFFTSWQSSWGKKPEDDAEDIYVYLVWHVKTIIKGTTQPYMLSLEDLFTVPGFDGEVVAYKLQEQSKYSLYDPEVGIVGGEYKCDFEYGRYDYIITRHLKTAHNELLDNPPYKYTVTNHVKTTVTPVDGVDDPTYREDDHSWSYERPHYNPPHGHFYMYKYGLDARNNYVRDYRDVRRDDLTTCVFPNGNPDLSVLDNPDYAFEKPLNNLEYYTYVHGYPYPWTIGPDDPGKKDNAEEDWARYAKETVTFELTDNEFYVKWLDGAYSPRLTKEDYQINFITLNSLMRDAELDLADQDGDGEYIEEKPVTYTDRDRIFIFAQFDDAEEWIPIGEYRLFDSDNPMVIYDGISEYVSSEGGKTTVVVFNNENHSCTGYRLVTSNKHYYTKLGAYPNVELKPSEKVKAVLKEAYQDGVAGTNSCEIALKNISYGRAYDDPCDTSVVDPQTNPNNLDYCIDQGRVYNDSRAGVDYVSGSIRHGRIKKEFDSFENDVYNRRAEYFWTIKASEVYTSRDNVDTLVLQNGGTFYDLLPLGASFSKDANTVELYADGVKVSKDFYRVSHIQGYAEGRDLLKVTTSVKAYEFGLTFSCFMSWDAILAIYPGDGTMPDQMLNGAAYETGNASIGEGSQDNGVGNRSDYFGPETGDQGKVYPGFNDLDPNTDDPKFIYTDCKHDVSVPVTAALDLSKKVIGNGGNPTEKDEVYSNGYYKYVYTFGTDGNTEATDLILYDSLENFVYNGNSSAWKGTLVSVDIKPLTQGGIPAEVYYSTVDPSLLGFAEHTNSPDQGTTPPGNFNLEATINGEPVWTTAKPADASTITAFAVDLRGEEGNRYVLKANHFIFFQVTMKAPESLPEGTPEGTDPVTYNDVFLFSTIRNVDDPENKQSRVIQHEHTEVRLRVVGDFRVKKIDATDPDKTITGIAFTLFRVDEDGRQIIVASSSTDNDGIAYFEDIPMGTYLLQETGGLDDYLIDPTGMRITVDQRGEVHIGEYDDETEQYDPSGYANLVELIPGDPITFVIQNTPRAHGDFSFIKKNYVGDGTERTETLSGAVFLLTGKSDYRVNEDDTLTFRATSDEWGRVTFENIEKGTYTLMEESAPEGFIKSDKKYTVIVDGNGFVTILNSDGTPVDESELEFSILTVINEPLHSFKVWKVDELTQALLPDAVFTLYQDGAAVAEVSTGASGIAEFTGLKSGTYVLKETGAPANHVLNETPYTVVIDKYGKVTIDGLEWNEDGFYFIFPNEREYNAKLVVRKYWYNDNATNADRPTPVFHVSTENPVASLPYATIDYNGSLGGNRWYDNALSGGLRSTATSFVHDTTSELPEAGRNVNQTKDTNDNTWYKIDDNTTERSIYFRMEGSTAYWWSDADIVFLPKRCYNMFYNCVKLTGTLDLHEFNTSKVTDMGYMFSECSKVQKINTTGWNTKNVQKMYYMFKGCTSLTDIIGIGSWNVINVGTADVLTSSGAVSTPQSMNGMFQGCASLTSLNLSGWGSTTQNVKSMKNMFTGCINLATLDMAGWETKNVRTMNSMFSDCVKLGATDVGLNVSHFHTGEVRDMSQMFYTSTHAVPGVDRTYMALKKLDLTTWVTGKVTTMAYMFHECPNLESIGNIGGWNVDNVRSVNSMFNNCKKLNGITGTGSIWDLSSWKPVLSGPMDHTFMVCTQATQIILSKPDSSSSTGYTGWDTTGVTSMDAAFANCSSLEIIDISSFTTGKLNNIKHTFANCAVLKHIFVNSTWSIQDGATLYQTFGYSGDGWDSPLLEGVDYSTGTATYFYYTNLSATYTNAGNENGAFAKIYIKGSQNGLLTDAKWKSRIYPPASGTSGQTTTAIAPDGISAAVASDARVVSLAANQTLTAAPVKLASGTVSRIVSGSADAVNVDAPAFETEQLSEAPVLTEAIGEIGTGNSADLMGVDNPPITDDDGNVIGFATEYISEEDGWMILPTENSPFWYYVFDVYAEEKSETIFYIWEEEIPGYRCYYELNQNYLGTAEHPIVVRMTYDPDLTPSVKLEEGTIDANGNFTPKTSSVNVLGPMYVGEIGNVYLATIRNTRSDDQSASLKVTKTLAGNGITSADLNKRFQFRVTLGDTSFSTVVNGVVFTNGVSEVFYLAGGESITFTGLPFGVEYTVEELDANTGGFVTTARDDTGFLPEEPEAGSTASISVPVAAFTNSKTVPELHYGDLIIKKTVVDDETGDEMTVAQTYEKEFDFTITLTGSYHISASETADAETLTKPYAAVIFEDANGNGKADEGETSRESYLQFTNGVASVKLKAGETIRIFDLPEGITYTVTEAESVGYALDDTNSSGMTGTIVRDNAGTATVSVINRYILKTGGFKIKKQVVGRETDEKFTITVILNGLVDGMPYSYQINDDEPVPYPVSSGEATVSVQIGDGDTVSFTNLPVGATYLVSEDASGYVASFTIVDENNAGTIVLPGKENGETDKSISTSTETLEEGEDITITFINRVPNYKVSFAKLDENEQYLSGAVLQILNADSNEVVEEWTTGAVGFNPRTLELREGHYIFREKTAPAGYLVAKDIEFIIEEDGTVKVRSVDAAGNPMVDGDNNPVYETVSSPVTIKMYDKPTQVKIKKLDEQGNSLSGAVLVIVKLDSLGREVAFHGNSWVTTTDNLGIYTSKMLELGTRYLLRELSAPTGYGIAEDIYFMIDENGDLYLTDKDGTVTEGPVEDLTIVMIDPDAFELPLTGGSGTAPYAIGGTLLMVAAAACVLELRRRRERQQSES